MTSTDDTTRKLAELRERYAAERAKRLRSDGNDQYVGFEAINREFDKDPFADPDFKRPQVVEEIEIAIVGAGLAGMMTAARLTERGIKDMRIIDKAGDFGGTWYWNRYPGAACDVESYIYMPFLEETGYMPTEKYAKAPEIFAHCQRIGRHFDLYPRALFQTQVSELRWDDAADRWLVTTNRGDRLMARFVAIAGGIMHKAKLPGIPGVETFEGNQFHTTRWDYDYTGGSPAEPMTNLKDKRVAIIGTGATAIQAVPKLAEAAGHLFVVQRTPAAVAPRDNRPTEPDFATSLKPGWQKERMENFTSIVSSEPHEIDMVGDGWTNIFRNIPNAYSVKTEEQHIADMKEMEKIRARVEQIVRRAEHVEGLKPWYNMMCKRPCFHDEYLPAFNRENVTLIDTGGKGVERLTETALVVDGKEYPVDCIIYASGFEISSFYVKRLGFEIYGRDGKSMTEDWGAAGPHTLHGIFSRGFPNLMMFSLVQGGISVNVAHIISILSQHVAEVIKTLKERGITRVESTAEAEEAWWQEIMKHLMNSAEFRMQCTPSYMNAEGKPDISMIKITPFQGTTAQFEAILHRWRDEGTLSGLQVQKEPEDA